MIEQRLPRPNYSRGAAAVVAAPGPAPDVAAAARRQRARVLAQAGFFVLFCLAPVFDLFRYDLVAGHAVILGMDWRIGLDAFFAGEIGATQAAVNILVRVLLPIVGGAALFIALAWRWGRLYCGWLCPHFSVVETVNALMRRASGKHSVWETRRCADRNADGSRFNIDGRWWLPTVLLAVAFAFVWAVVLLTYLLPPAEVYSNLWHGTPTRNQFIFITAGTVVLSIEFLLARHLFCRFGCAVGMFQSVAWMSNREALVVGFDRPRAGDCAACYNDRLTHDGPGEAACETACPMRLKPRGLKRTMFACTQCAQCVSACATVQRHRPEGTLLRWVEGDAARRAEAAVSLTGRR